MHVPAQHQHIQGHALSTLKCIDDLTIYRKSAIHNQLLTRNNSEGKLTKSSLFAYVKRLSSSGYFKSPSDDSIVSQAVLHEDRARFGHHRVVKYFNWPDIFSLLHLFYCGRVKLVRHP